MRVYLLLAGVVYTLFGLLFLVAPGQQPLLTYHLWFTQATFWGWAFLVAGVLKFMQFDATLSGPAPRMSLVATLVGASVTAMYLGAGFAITAFYLRDPTRPLIWLFIFGLQLLLRRLTQQLDAQRAIQTALETQLAATERRLEDLTALSADYRALSPTGAAAANATGAATSPASAPAGTIRTDHQNYQQTEPTESEAHL